MRVSEERFEELVDAALAAVPEHFMSRIKNLAFLIADYHPDSPWILGLYNGVPLPQRTLSFGTPPNTITLYSLAIQDQCDTEEELAEQIRITVMHEIGHYFGLEEEDLHRLGYA